MLHNHRTPHNKGKPNTNSRVNAMKGAAKNRAHATGRRIAVRDDGSRYWIKP